MGLPAQNVKRRYIGGAGGKNVDYHRYVIIECSPNFDVSRILLEVGALSPPSPPSGSRNPNRVYTWSNFRCWRECDDERPSFKEIQTEMVGLMKENGLKSNMMDNMVELMEKYTNHLEDIVAQRTGELRNEQQKTG